MSILVKGVKMPRCCEVCPCSHMYETAMGLLAFGCKINMRTREIGCDTRPEWCPLIEAPEDGVQFVKWIPVAERLPDVGKKVLVFAYGNDVITARMKKQTENGYHVFECNGIFLEMAKTGRITHWMPLLEAPEMEKEEP